ncbi:MAG: hypothetical protein E7043_08900 [Lentisphaerae bacterium]|nr:hypothetical protein [Lentisphaerota bacterium]
MQIYYVHSQNYKKRSIMKENNCLFADPFWGNGATAAPPGQGLAKHWNWLKAQSGNTHPGALPPFGWISVLPYSGAYSSGYGCIGVSCDGEAPKVFDRQMAKGFTHLHTTGVGFLGEFYNFLLLTPAASGYDASSISRLDDEHASPGYYKGKLSDYGVEFELTADKFSAVHRCKFASGSGSLHLNPTQIGLEKTDDRQEKITACEYHTVSPDCFAGSVTAHGETIFFAWMISGDISKQYIDGDRMVFKSSSVVVESVLGFSRSSESEAVARARHTCSRGFERTATDTRKLWQDVLNCFQTEFDNESDKYTFYSALYHSLLKPVDSGTEYTDFQTMWDIYRTQLPLVMTIAPETGKNILRTMLHAIDRIGYFPCTYMLSDDRDNHNMQATALSVYTLADGFFRDLLTAADYPLLKKAFISEFSHADVSKKSPTHTLDLSGAYFAASLVAERCGDMELAGIWLEKSGIWRKVYDQTTGVLIDDAVYYEGDCWTYSFRPHVNMAERTALAGGEKSFEALLDKFFGFGCQDSYPIARPQIPHRFEGMNNESDMETPAAYLWCGRADKQAQVHAAIRQNMFSNGIGGCPGNNDSGGLSSWYVWSCLGLIPLTGTPYMLLASPAVKHAELPVGTKKLIIEVERNSASAVCPLYYEFKGSRFTEPYIALKELADGGTLKFVMGEFPTGKSPIPDWL